MDLNKILNDSLDISISDNEQLMEGIIDDLLDVIPEDEREFNGSQWAEYEQKIVNIVRRIASLSVLSSIHALKTIEYENLKEKELSLTNSLKEKSHHLNLVKKQHSDEPDNSDEV